MTATAHVAWAARRPPLFGLAGARVGPTVGSASPGRLVQFALAVGGASDRSEFERYTHDLLCDVWQPDRVVRREVRGPRAGHASSPYVAHTPHQILLVTRLERRVESSGWIITRSRRPFTAQEVDAAYEVLPLLVLLEGLYLDGSPTRAQAARPVLTGRELEILQLLPLGLTAEAMGRQLGISGRTVRKHLEHIYSKLQCHDRLVAVLRARDLQLL